MIRSHTLVVGPFQCNCTLLVDEDSKEALVIDPGDEFDRIRALCETHGVKPRYAMHTHAHLDHIGATAELKRWNPSTVLALHRADESLYQSLPMQGQMFGLSYDVPPPIDRFVEDTEKFKLGAHEFEVLHTPGHSPGGICLHFSGGALFPEPVVFTGDTLFQLSIGRTDLWGGDFQRLMKSITNRLLTLDDQTRLFPGHGPTTTVGVERRENPFL